ncbi:MAG: alginate export family protein [Pseudomonadota bacterium]
MLSLCSLCSVALAQENKEETSFRLLPKDVYFQPGGGLRVRYESLNGATGRAFPDEERESQATHRALFDVKLYKGEYFETFFRFLNFSDWGSAVGDTSGGQHDGFARRNGLLVNQAYALWKVGSSMGIRFGRVPLHLGLGNTYGHNDWFNVPYSFDLFEFAWDWDSVELSLIAAKVQELSRVVGQAESPDPEENNIIINLDIKNLIDSLNVFNFNFVQVNRDLGSADGGTTVQNGLNSQRFSLDAEIKGKQFFATLFLSFVTGQENVAAVNQTNNIGEFNLSQSAGDLKVGYQFPESNQLRLWAGYHRDTGDRVAGDDKSQSYDSFFYEVYGQSGYMDFIRWGNLSFYHIGFDMEIPIGVESFPFRIEELKLGTEWWSFTRTETADTVRFGDAGRFLNTRIQNGSLNLGDSKDLGSELDIWFEMPYSSGVNLRTTLSGFFPGAAFNDSTDTSNGDPLSAGSSIFQFLTQVEFYF